MEEHARADLCMGAYGIIYNMCVCTNNCNHIQLLTNLCTLKVDLKQIRSLLENQIIESGASYSTIHHQLYSYVSSKCLYTHQLQAYLVSHSLPLCMTDMQTHVLKTDTRTLQELYYS